MKIKKNNFFFVQDLVDIGKNYYIVHQFEIYEKARVEERQQEKQQNSDSEGRKY